MGNNEEENKESKIIDFLYKDSSLINSFYSQIFGGDIVAVEKSILDGQESNDTLSGTMAVVKGESTSKEISQRKQIQNINPYDYKIIKLLDKLSLEENNLTSSNLYSIVSVKGSLYFRDYDVLTKLLPFMGKSGLVPEFNQSMPGVIGGKGNKNKITIGDMLSKAIELLPYGLEFDIETKNNKDAVCIIKENGLCISSNDILRAYGSKMPGEWVVIGILDKREVNSRTNGNQFKSVMDSALSEFVNLIADSKDNIIRPIVIYRELEVG